jgi:hypothetical protein
MRKVKISARKLREIVAPPAKSSSTDSSGLSQDSVDNILAKMALSKQQRMLHTQPYDQQRQHQHQHHQQRLTSHVTLGQSADAGKTSEDGSMSDLAQCEPTLLPLPPSPPSPPPPPLLLLLLLLSL